MPLWCLLPTLATNDHSYLMFHGLLRSLLLKLRKYNRSPKYQTSRRAPGRLTSERQRRLGAATCTSARQAGSRATESRSSNGHQRAPDGHQGNEGSKRQPALAGTRRAFQHCKTYGLELSKAHRFIIPTLAMHKRKIAKGLRLKFQTAMHFSISKHMG